MKLSTLIAKALAILQAEGDLDVLDGEFCTIRSIKMVESDGSYPADWDLPSGLKFVKIETSK